MINLKKLVKKLNKNDTDKGFDFVKWAIKNGKDIFRLAFDENYMKSCSDEYYNVLEVDYDVKN